MRAPSSALRLMGWLRRFWPGATRQPPPVAPPDPLRTAGQLLRDSREAKGLRLRDLAQRTRISIAVLEALEGGWKDRLPEATYLRTMLSLLEHELDLPPGSLAAALPVAGQGTREKGRGQGLTAAVFSPFTIHVLARWQGTVLYALLILGLLLAINAQQRRLAALGRLALNPIPLATVATDASETFPGRHGGGQAEIRSPLSTELQPLSRAAAGVAMRLLAQENQRGGLDGSLGALRLTLASPTRLELRGPRSGVWRVERLQGDISLPVLPPFQLHLSPAPPPGAVRWKGQPLRPAAPSPRGATSGRYAVPSPST
ncbi:MAG: helix-turn-helix domain-containing protein [Cyanobacteriota bacterium]